MKPRESVLCHSAAATQELGVRLAGELAPGDTVALNGDLGAGKTCLIQGICRGLGVQDWVNSPTFILINEYRGRADVPIYHFDLYRIQAPEELEDLGAEEYFSSDGICLIEWAERAAALLPPQRVEVELAWVADQVRRITIHGKPDREDALPAAP